MKWENNWLMSFNPDKCEVIRITNKQKQLTSDYYIHRKKFVLHVTVPSAKYLGLHFENNLSWNKHIDTITKKANSSTAFLNRNLKGCPPSVNEKCYTALVRPLVEYASTVWSLHTAVNINKIEQVQRLFDQICHQSSVTEMLQKLKWDSLQERLARSQLVKLYKIQYQLVAIPDATYLVPSTRSTRGHDIRYLQQHATHRNTSLQTLILPDSNQALEHFTSNCSWISDSGAVYQRYYRDQINTINSSSCFYQF